MNRKVGVFFSYLLIIAEALFSVFITPYMIKFLGNAEYGVYKLNETVTTYLLLLDLGVGQAVVRWIAKYRANNDHKGAEKFLGITSVFYLIVSIIVIIGGQVLINLTPKMFAVGLTDGEIELFRQLMNVTIINAACTLLTTPFVNTIVGYERFSFSKSVSIIQIILRTILFVFALNLGMRSFGLVIAQLIVTIIGRTACILYVLFAIHLRPVFHDFDRNVVKEIVSFSSLLFIIMISTQLNDSLDNILLAAFSPGASVMVAVYSVALQIAYYFNAIGSGMTGVLMPGVVRMVEGGADSESLTREMIRIGRLVFSMGAFVVVGFIVCGKRFIYLWVGHDFEIAYYVAIPLLIVYMFMQFQSIGDNILTAKNELKEFAVMRLVVIVVNIVISLSLIKWNPVIGVMIGTITSLILGGIVIKNLLFIKYIDLDLKIYYSQVLKGIFVSGVLSVAICLLINRLIGESLLGFLIIVVITSIVYMILIWCIGYTSSERQYIKGILRKAMKK